MLILAGCIGLFQLSQAQVNRDSLLRIWNDDSQADTSRLKAVFDLAENGFGKSMPDSISHYADLAYSFSRSNDLRRGEVHALHLKGKAFAYKGLHEEAMDHFEKSMKIAQKVGDKMGIAENLNEMAYIYRRRGNTEEGDLAKALDYHSRSIRMAREIGAKELELNALTGKGTIFFIKSDHAEAIGYYTEAINLADELGDKKKKGSIQVNIGNIYYQLGDFDKAIQIYQLAFKAKMEAGEPVAKTLMNIGAAYGSLDKYNEASNYFHSALEEAKSEGNKKMVASILGNIGRTSFNLGDYAKALRFYKQSLEGLEKIGDKREIAKTTINIGSVQYHLGNYSKALRLGNEGLSLSREVEDADNIEVAAKLLSETYTAMGRHKEALEMLILKQQMQDSTQSEKNQRAVIRMEYKSQYEKQAMADSLEFVKQQAIDKLELKNQHTELVQQRIALISIGVGLLLVLALLYAIYRGKKRSDKLLLNILPKEIATELKVNGFSQAKLIKEATVLFTDFKGFTSLASKMNPEELVTELNVCFSAFDRIMETYGIEKIKTIGDAYMAAGGLPSPNAGHALDVVKAALEIREFMTNYASRRKALGKEFFQARIGIHTGPVVAGIVGIQKFQYDIWGDTVNTASRIESNGEIGMVNISQSTYEKVRHEKGLIFQSRGKIQAKGKGELEMYYVDLASNHNGNRIP